MRQAREAMQMMRTMVLIDGENLVCRYQDMVRNGDADVAEARRRHGPLNCASG